MRWRLMALIASLPLLAVQAAQTQNTAPLPTCAVACSVNPFTAPANCDCSAPGGEASQTPTEPAPQTQPAPAAAQVPVEPGVPSCQLACSVNPFTVPPGCDCTAIATTGGGTAAGGSGPSFSPEAVAEDGLLSVGEILDYMDQLYRARIAGVQQYYYLERMVVGQSSPQASLPPRKYAIVPVVFHPQEAALSGPLSGVDTMLTSVKELEKVDRDGHPAMKVLTPQEQARRAASEIPPPPDASADEIAAAEALTNDPSLFFGALAGLADAFGAGPLGDQLEQIQSEMAADFQAETQDDELFSEDVLGELIELKKVQDAEVAAAIAEGDSADSVAKRTLYLGHYERGSLRFTLGPRCASAVGCSFAEIERFISTTAPDLLSPDPEFAGEVTSYMLNHVICIVWRPTGEALAEFKMPGAPLEGDSPGVPAVETDPVKATVNNATRAELWLPISHDLMPELVGGAPGLQQVNQDFEALGEEAPNYDRPIRMKLVLATPTNAGFQVQRLDRVYDDFQKIVLKDEAGTGDGQALFEPHRIREQIAMGVCPQSADPEATLGAIGSTLADGESGPVDTSGCIFDSSFVSDAYRKDFVVNGDWLNAQEKALVVAEPW